MDKFPGGSLESKAERVLSKERILDALSRYAEGAVPVRELSDDKGVYLLEVEIAGEAPGETTQYYYIRKGEHGNQNASQETMINVVHYEDGIPVGGESVARFNAETDEWDTL